MRKKKQILKYYSFSSKKSIKTIYEQLINKKALNLTRYQRKKSKN